MLDNPAAGGNGVHGRRVTAWIVRIAIVLTIVASVLWVHLFEFLFGLGFDSHVFLLIGKGIHYGLLPYRDLFEAKPPAIFYYFAGVFSVLPVALWSVRITDFVLYLCGAAAYYALCREDVGRPMALVGTFVWIYLSHHPGFNFNGLHTEEYVSVFAILAVTAAAQYRTSRSPLTAALSGLAASGALSFKHPGVTVVLPALILIADRSALTILPLFLLAFGTPLVLVLGYFWQAGALPQFLEANLWDLIAYGHLGASAAALWPRVTELGLQMGRLLSELPAIAVGLALGVAACVTRPTRFRIAAVVWLFADMLAVGAEGKYFRHHFIQMFPAMVLVACIGAAWLLQPRPREARYWVALRFVVGATVLLVSWPSLRAIYAFRQPVVKHAWDVLLSGPRAWPTETIGPDEGRMARYIHERTRPGDRIHVAGWGGGLPGVYWAADRLPASRHFFPILTLGPRPEADRELLADLERNKPRYILLLPLPEFVQNLAPFLAKNYTIEKVFYDQYEIWVRNAVEAFASGTEVGLSLDATVGGLVLQPEQTSSGGRRDHAPLLAKRAGRWTSPVIPVASDDGKVIIDWAPRSDIATGTGIAVRYRTGPTPDLDNAPWLTIESPDSADRAPRIHWTGSPHPRWATAEDPDAAVWVPIEAYVQVQCELWSADRTLTPVLRYAQIGGVRFASQDNGTSESASH